MEFMRKMKLFFFLFTGCSSPIKHTENNLDASVEECVDISDGSAIVEAQQPEQPVTCYNSIWGIGRIIR